MIGCEISGGLGNQFFRYAFSRNMIEIRKKLGIYDELVINFSATDDHGFEGNLSDFNIIPHKTLNCRRVLQKRGTLYQIFLYIVITRIFHFLNRTCNLKISLNTKSKILGKIGVILSESPDNEKLYINKNYERIFPIGSFENASYFNDIKDILCQEFTPRHKELKKNKELYNIIRNQNSICLAVRRGDFMKEENKKIFYVCDLTYFQKAVEYMLEHVENPTFIVFSNDIPWVKDNIKIKGEVHYESGNDPVWETFRLMYSCKHFVISNSTFHWWAQYKATYPNKIVISPDRWYNTPGWESHLMLDYFIKIPTGVKNPYTL